MTSEWSLLQASRGRWLVADLMAAGECPQGINASKEIKLPQSAVRPVLLKILARIRFTPFGTRVWQGDPEEWSRRRGGTLLWYPLSSTMFSRLKRLIGAPEPPPTSPAAPPSKVRPVLKTLLKLFRHLYPLIPSVFWGELSGQWKLPQGGIHCCWVCRGV